MWKMKILITGASGFVGHNVKEYLQKNKAYEIYSPSSKELNCIDERCVTEYLKKHSFDYVLHFAVYGYGTDKNLDTDKILEYNLRIFYNFAKSSSCYGRMLYAGSGAEYDKRYDISGVTEEEIGRTIPVDPYGLMKYVVGQHIEQSKNIYNLRLFGIFGKYEAYSTKFISNVCCKALKDIPLSIRQNVYFDYLWVEDFCRMIELFMHSELQYHTYNAVLGKRISLREICDIVKKLCGKELPVFVCREGLGKEYTASNERFRKEFPKFHYTPIEKAIQKLYQWYQENDNIDIYQLLYS